jgi:hypothetical protein
MLVCHNQTVGQNKSFENVARLKYVKRLQHIIIKFGKKLRPDEIPEPLVTIFSRILLSSRLQSENVKMNEAWL